MFTFKNNCHFTVWPATLSGQTSPPLASTGFELAPGTTTARPLDAPPKWQGRLWGRYGCSTNSSSGKFACVSGDCASGQVPCNGAGGIPPATLAEFTLQGYDNKDFYDISCVDGFNLPLSIEPQGVPGCTSPSCPKNINVRCPEELAVTSPYGGVVVGCRSACMAFNADKYCCRGAYVGPNACKPSMYSQIFKEACPLAYSYAYDDSSSLFTCVGASYHITFCP